MSDRLPIHNIDRSTFYLTVHGLNAKTGRLWRWWDEKAEGWRDGDSVEFADALVDAYALRLRDERDSETER